MEIPHTVKMKMLLKLSSLIKPKEGIHGTKSTLVCFIKIQLAISQ